MVLPISLHERAYFSYKENRVITQKLIRGLLMKIIIFILIFMSICNAQEYPSPRQVVIGGQIAADTHKENNPLTLLASPLQAKSAMHHTPGYKELLTKSLCSQSEPLTPDLVIACAACMSGVCFAHTNCPQTSMLCNLTANGLVCCLLGCYWVNDTPEEFTTATLAKKIKSDARHFLCFWAKKHA